MPADNPPSTLMLPVTQESATDTACHAMQLSYDSQTQM